MYGVKVITAASAAVLLIAAGPVPALADTIEAALVRAEKIEPLPSHLTAQLTPSDSVTVDNLREGLKAILQHQAVK